VKEQPHFSAGDGTGSDDSTSPTLLAKIQRRDPEGWKRLCAAYTPLVRWWCHRRGLSGSDAEDLVQDVLLTVHRKVDEFVRGPQRGSFRAWLREITRFKITEHLRQRQRQPVGEGGSEVLGRLAQVPDSAGEDEETEGAILLRAALDVIRGTVEPRTWEAATRYLIGHESSADVARALGMTPNAVHIACARIRKKVREEFPELLD
jgi:RNA polymerase sigma-70 factor (ECF subfamily)